MDLTVIFALVSGLVIIILMFFVLRQRSKVRSHEAAQLRRGPVARNARARLRAAAATRQDEEDEDEDGEQEKIGAKKRAKLEAKAERKAQREAEEREREDKKKKQLFLEEERKKVEEKEKLDDEKREEEERKAKEEKERQEHEEYLKLKASFNIEEEGFDDTDIDNANLLQDFINYIKDTKVILLEDLAAKFHMKTQSVISRIHDLQADERLTGVIDDRGKFIYISQEELNAVAKFVKQRGRVSLTELVENSQQLINLIPNIITIET